MEETDHPAYAKLQEIGLEITQKVKPKAVVVRTSYHPLPLSPSPKPEEGKARTQLTQFSENPQVFSAHWQGSQDTVQVNTAESLPLIYDFYGFPKHYYSLQFPNIGSPELAQRLLDLFAQRGIKATGVQRGLDHGVWAGFTCLFNPSTNPLGVPVVQVSLFGSEDPDQHYKLGEAIASLREEGVVVIGSGMAVHNLRDMWKAMQSPMPMPYTVSFDAALKDAVEAKPEQRQRAMEELVQRPDARKAHPSFDHLLPVHVAAGAAGGDVGKRVWTLPEGSMAWAQFRFGEVSAQAAVSR